ncbi:hypothetical protein ACF1B0_24050 [Streptomyces anandii]|uniref:hypothetical protein n=1 Tax=Streptomyces anandii TaxID=285454 RepID=UPI00167ACEF5|nr:hypothetical protein [Streptomyces anandii]GGX96865.1 hypothetical protein GCM10010510_47890 [Streptomyces anandii JCM 4720]
MYEMCAGVEKHGGALVWHVMAKNTAVTLCGTRLDRQVDGVNAQRAGHCSTCMALFGKLMTAPPVVSAPAATDH